MAIFLLILSILLIFRVEVIHLFINLNFVQWSLFLAISLACLFYRKRSLKYSVLLITRKIKYQEPTRAVEISGLVGVRERLPKPE